MFVRFINVAGARVPKNVFSLLVAVLLAFLLSACGGRESAVSRATAEGVLLIDNGAEPRDLDPHLVTGIPEHHIIKAILEGLVAEHPTDSNRVSPGVAERWESNEDASVWTFYLREDARWSNGDPVTADDFVYGHRRLLDPELAAPYVGMLSPIRGAEAYNAGELRDWAQVGVEAVDAHTLRYTLKGPTSYFPLMLTHYTYFPLHQPTIERFNAFRSRTSGWTRAGNFVGNGPFVLSEWLPNQRITVDRSETYWDREAVSLESIRFFPYEDRQMAVRAFMAGQIHKTDGVPYNMRDRLRQEGAPYFFEDPMFATSYLGLNTRHSGLNDARVRRALHMAIDVQQIIDQVTKTGQPAEGFVPPGIEGYPYEEHYDYSPDRARQLLVEAGYPGGEGFPRLSFITANADTSRTFAEIVQAAWKRELGIDVVIENKEWQVLIAEMDEGNFDVFLLSWIGDYIDPSTFLSIMQTGDGNNRTGFSHSRYDELLRQAAQTGDPDQRFGLLAEAESILMEERPIIPLTWNRFLYLLHPDVEGWGHEKLIMDQSYKAVRLQDSGFEF